MKKSFLDLFLVFKQVLPYFKKMVIEKNQDNQLTNFPGCNQNRKVLQYLFNKITSKLRNCFKSGSSFQDKASQFKKTLEGVFQKSFKKIRGTKIKTKPTDLDLQILKRSSLKKKILDKHIGKTKKRRYSKKNI